MSTKPCPAWEYENHPDRDRLLPAAADRLVTGIQAGKFPVKPFASDTRSIHCDLFTGLTPRGFGYYAGNYRGSLHYCLEKYEVTIASDPMVGAKAALVQAEMDRFGRSILTAVDKVADALESKALPLPPTLKAIAVVRIACSALAAFLTVHPYANGNGHTARALLWIVLAHFGFIPDGWTVEPTIPGYGALIAQHRRGNRQPLEQYVLKRISLARRL